MTNVTSHAGTCPAKYLKLRAKLERALSIHVSLVGHITGLRQYLRDHFPELYSKHTFIPKGSSCRLRTLDILSLMLDLGFPLIKNCSECNKRFSLKKNKPGSMFCSPSCGGKSAKSKQKAIETCLRNHGVQHCQQSSQVRHKARATMLRRYGAECSFQVTSCLEKRIKTWKRKLGVTHPSKSNAIKKKKSETSMKNYGTLHPMQNPEVFQRTVSARYVRKEFYDQRTNKIHTYQGYEGVVLEELSQNPNVERFRSLQDSPIPVPYSKGRQVYFPDTIAKLKSGRTILIEVKSTWTIGSDKNPKTLAVNMRKFRAAERFCSSRGWEFWLAVVEDGCINWTKSPSRVFQ